MQTSPRQDETPTTITPDHARAQPPSRQPTHARHYGRSRDAMRRSGTLRSFTSTTDRRSEPVEHIHGADQASLISVQAGRERGPGTVSLRVESTWNEQSDPLAPFVVYWKARFVDDPHMWASALFDEVLPLGYGCSYPSFARQVRLAGLRPHSEACAGVKGRGTIEIAHPAGEEIQWDWAERRNAPWGATSYGLLGTLSPGASRWTNRRLVCATHRRTPVTTRLASGLGRVRVTAGSAFPWLPRSDSAPPRHRKPPRHRHVPTLVWISAVQSVRRAR